MGHPRLLFSVLLALALVSTLGSVAHARAAWILRDRYWVLEQDGQRLWQVRSGEANPGMDPEVILQGTSLGDSLAIIGSWECRGNVLEGGQLHARDLNSNGRPDMAYGNSIYDTFVRESSQNDTFPLVHQVSNPVGSYYTTLRCVGDGDSDGLQELVFGSGTSGVPRDLFIMEARAPGEYPDSVTAVIPEINISVGHMRMTDLDGDGQREYLGTCQGDAARTVAMWENRGDNSYEQVFSAHPGPYYTVAGEPSVGDFDGDGRGDFVVGECAQEWKAVHVYECRGNDSYQEVWSDTPATTNILWSCPGPDLDRDGRGDFVVAGGVGMGQALWSFILYESTGDDMYAPVWTHQIVGGWIHGGVATGDIDGDGWNELVCQVADRTQVLRSVGDNALEVIWDFPGPVIGQGEHRIIAPDLDGDGKGELIWWIHDRPGQAVVYEYTGSPAALLPPAVGLGRLGRLLPCPSPFRQETLIRYEIPWAARSLPIRLAVFDPAGSLIRVWSRASSGAGWHGHPWDGNDESGRAVADGVYFVRLQMGEVNRTARIIRVR